MTGLLPSTGGGDSGLLPIAAWTVGIGGLLLLVVRRRRPTHA
jgi:LPXTG-motif cell wall-anchored protein